MTCKRKALPNCNIYVVLKTFLNVVQARIYGQLCLLIASVICCYSRFKTNLHMSLLQITGYKKLYLDVENLRKVTYDSDNEEHEEQLIEVKKIHKLKAKAVPIPHHQVQQLE